MQLKGLDLKLISEADDKSKDDYRPGNPFITFRSEVWHPRPLHGLWMNIMHVQYFFVVEMESIIKSIWVRGVLNKLKGSLKYFYGYWRIA